MDMRGLLYGLLSLQMETLLYPTAKMPKNEQYGMPLTKYR
jgi:hypothetical protein